MHTSTYYIWREGFFYKYFDKKCAINNDRVQYIIYLILILHLNTFANATKAHEVIGRSDKSFYLQK